MQDIFKTRSLAALNNLHLGARVLKAAVDSMTYLKTCEISILINSFWSLLVVWTSFLSSASTLAAFREPTPSPARYIYVCFFLWPLLVSYVATRPLPLCGLYSFSFLSIYKFGLPFLSSISTLPQDGL